MSDQQQQQPKERKLNFKDAGLTGHSRQRVIKELKQAEELRKILPWFTIIKK